MFDDADKPAEPDWKAIATLVMQQRDRAEAKANNLEIDLALAQQREAALRAQLEVPPSQVQAVEPSKPVTAPVIVEMAGINDDPMAVEREVYMARKP